MWSPWVFVRCQVVGKHRWEPVHGASRLDSGWRCRDCQELLLERHLLERNHDPDECRPYGTWGGGAGAALPGP